MNKNKWNSLPADVQKIITDYSTKEFLDQLARRMERDRHRGPRLVPEAGRARSCPISDAESARWVKAAQPVIADFKKDMVSKGYKAAEVDGWISFIRERIEYWKAQEKAQKIPTAYQY